MKNTHVIILAGGYATRLFPLTLNQPKPLLPIAGKPILGHILDDLDQKTSAETIHIVGNHKFATHFEDWLKMYSPSRSINITFTNDGSTDDSNKLGAIGDLHLIINSKKIDGDVFVIAGDNLLGETLQNFFSYAKKLKQPIVGVHDLNDLEKTKKYSSISIDQHMRIIGFEEKPQKPKSSMIGVALYYYPKKTLPLINRYITEGNNPDQPGRLIEWLHTRTPVYAWPTSDVWFDIGSKETLAEAEHEFRSRYNLSTKTPTSY